ncbi:hypothetical protein FOPE_00857 [Fonsecaea pedrosoi]|nr:hypothetical protein FOPE_00857 [Fonsecaea pedrosoi]
MEHAVWLKNRSPARALRKREKKTPWEAIYGDQPDLSMERIWGSRTYVTLAHEKTGNKPKLHTSRAWPGYWMGCVSESICRIYSPDKGKVFKVGMARVEDGEGLEDIHQEPSRNQRLPPPEINIDDLPSDRGDETEGDSESEILEDLNECDDNEIPEEQDAIIQDMEPENGSSEEPVYGSELPEVENENHRPRSATPDDFWFESQDEATNEGNWTQDETSDETSDSETDDGEAVRSKYFAGQAVKKSGERKKKKNKLRKDRNHFPDDSKCDQCFRAQVRYDRE